MNRNLSTDFAIASGPRWAYAQCPARATVNRDFEEASWLDQNQVAAESISCSDEKLHCGVTSIPNLLIRLVRSSFQNVELQIVHHCNP
jgi:hypothetical protein